jgi:hypothetical protein
MKYKAVVRATYRFEVEAENEDEAHDKAEQEYASWLPEFDWVEVVEKLPTTLTSDDHAN